MATVAVYCTDPNVNPAKSLIAGLTLAGFSVKGRRGSVFDASQFEKQFDAVVTIGARGGYGRAASAYTERHVPVFILEAAFVRREDGYVSISKGTINSLAPHFATAERVARIGYQIPSSPSDPRGESILVLGQVPGDAQHGMDAQRMDSYLTELLSIIREVSARPVVFRPHPKAALFFPQIVRNGSAMLDQVSSLEENLAAAHCAVTYNSAAGFAALAAGVPVFSNDSAAYFGMSSNEIDLLESPPWPSKAKIDSFLRQLASSTWSLEEVAGDPEFGRTMTEIIEQAISDTREQRAAAIDAEYHTIEERIEQRVKLAALERGANKRMMGHIGRRGRRGVS